MSCARFLRSIYAHRVVIFTCKSRQMMVNIVVDSQRPFIIKLVECCPSQNIFDNNYHLLT